MKKDLKVLHSAPLDIEISPRLKYAGTERVLLYLNGGLSRLGHTSVVAAPGNSDLGGFGALLPTRETHLWVSEGNQRTIVRSPEAYESHYRQCLDYVASEGMDLVHDHPGRGLVESDEYLERGANLGFPVVTTIHSIASQNNEERYALLRRFQEEGRDLHFAGISKSHVKKFEEDTGVKFDGFVYNGVPLDLLPFQEEGRNYMLWLGRLSNIKGTDIAVEVARRTGTPLVIAGEVHNPYRAQFESKIHPHLTGSVESEKERQSLLERLAGGEDIVSEGDILFVGPVDDYQKSILYRNAFVTLQPNRWEEPFGLVPVESMASGTPVIVTDRGALPELVVDGKSGFIVESGGEEPQQELITQGFIDRLEDVRGLNRADSRKNVAKRFSLERMAGDYVDFYRGVLNG